ncbi:MAG: hypothetical protein M1816_002182 [Peltula sp. TS41687]|nr:MAG: hypothetical protein M1816_002182 [Peltula sp. TS41687]
MNTGLSPFFSNVGYYVAISLYLNQLVWCAINSPTPTPLSLPSSQYWDGNDGPWSSFGMLVGTPPQKVRLLPATSGNTLWVVLPEGCIAGDPSDCSSLRGSEFRVNQSSTWTRQGNYYQLPLTTQDVLGYSGNALAGYDNITLGWQGYGLPSLAHQVVAGIATKDFYLGSLGLKPQSVNFTTSNNPLPSMLQSLRNESKVPSASWGYTAGAYYQQPRVFGSLTLGGFDSTRFAPNNVSFPFGADISKDLLVGIQSITFDAGSSPLLSKGIFAFIDSLVPHIWLPLEVCEAFEKAFGLVWNETSKLYLLTEDRHNRLVDLNPNVTFKLGPSLTDGATVDIVMPYGSFDLTARSPLVRNSTRYFPLKRAENDTQYTLGRAFLQQAYIIADYERSNFSVHQTLFPSTSVPQNLIAIRAPGDTVRLSGSKGGLKTGAIIGIVVAILAIIIILCCVLAFFIRHRRRRRVAAQAATQEAEEARYQKPELDTTEITIPQQSRDIKPPGLELPDDANSPHLWPQEMPSKNTIPGKADVISELPSKVTSELPTEAASELSGVAASELPTEAASELPGGDILNPKPTAPTSPPATLDDLNNVSQEIKEHLEVRERQSVAPVAAALTDEWVRAAAAARDKVKAEAEAAKAQERGRRAAEIADKRTAIAQERALIAENRAAVAETKAVMLERIMTAVSY